MKNLLYLFLVAPFLAFGQIGTVPGEVPIYPSDSSIVVVAECYTALEETADYAADDQLNWYVVSTYRNDGIAGNIIREYVVNQDTRLVIYDNFNGVINGNLPDLNTVESGCGRDSVIVFNYQQIIDGIVDGLDTLTVGNFELLRNNCTRAKFDNPPMWTKGDVIAWDEKFNTATQLVNVESFSNFTTRTLLYVELNGVPVFGTLPVFPNDIVPCEQYDEWLIKEQQGTLDPGYLPLRQTSAPNTTPIPSFFILPDVYNTIDVQNHTATTIEVSFTSTGFGVESFFVGPFTSFSSLQHRLFTTISGTLTITYLGDVGDVIFTNNPQVIINLSKQAR